MKTWMLWLVVLGGLLQPLAAQEFIGSGNTLKLQVITSPQAVGPGVVTLQITTPQGQPAPDWQITQASLYMPGMEMELSPVKILPQGGNRWQLQVDAPMQGLWKVNLALKQGEATETATLKFVIP